MSIVSNAFVVISGAIKALKGKITFLATTGNGIEARNAANVAQAGMLYDATLTSKWKVGASASESEVVTVGNAQTLINKTLTSPAITTPTGLVKGDVGLGNVDNTSDATKNAATATLTNKTLVTPLIYDSSGTKLLSLDFAGTTGGLITTFDFNNSTHRTYTFPNAAATLAGTDLAQNWTQVQTFNSGVVFDDAGGQSTLNFYEQGTWTPSYASTLNLSSPTIGTGSGTARYTRIGNLVFATVQVTGSLPLTTAGARTLITIGSLPYFTGMGASSITVRGTASWGSATRNEPGIIGKYASNFAYAEIAFPNQSTYIAVEIQFIYEIA